MKQEIDAGVKFLREFLAKYGQLTALQIEQFATKLTRLLEERYSNHWYESQPMKGQAFRCLRLKHADNYIDPVLEQILRECGLSLSQLGLPNDFTLWIDPGEVSVRFGDQIGYTYTIARFEIRPAGEPSSVVLMNNSEKIFDDKLTAFIRQNSTTAASEQFVSVPEIEPQVEDKSNLDDDEQILDAVASLSVDTRSVHGNKRVNSSNISINPVFGAKNSVDNEMGETSLLNHNRQSYNDSCYYSSSSSSCASSFEADGPLSWMKNRDIFAPEPSQLLMSNIKSSLFPQSSSSSVLFADAASSPQNTDSLIIPFDSMDPFAETLYPMLASPDVASFGGSLAQIFSSETSSQRSDTPNSCMTTSSTQSGLPSSILAANFMAPVQDQTITSDLNAGLQQQSSSSSDGSTSTAVASLPSSLSKSPQVVDESNKNKPKGKKKKDKSPKSAINGSKESSLGSTPKKDDSYCGYVESFPYYYKLNRLYNALAVQKIQTERLKKTGMLNVKTIIGSGVSSGSGGTPTGSRPGSSLSSKIELNATSPVAGSADVSSQMFLKQHPIGSVLSSSLQSTNSHHPVKQPPFGSPGNFRYAHPHKDTMTPPPPTNTANNGYPMSPTNAAISFANHHHRMNSSSKTHTGLKHHQQLSANQQASQMLPFNNLINNLDFMNANSSSINTSFHGSFLSPASVGFQPASLPQTATRVNMNRLFADPLADFAAPQALIHDLLKSND